MLRKIRMAQRTMACRRRHESVCPHRSGYHFERKVTRRPLAAMGDSALAVVVVVDSRPVAVGH